MWPVVILAGGTMVLLAVFGVVVLSRAQKAWRVQEDPLIEKVESAMAGLDCGACGYPSCNEYAHAVVEKGDAVNKCRPGGVRSTRAVAELMGVEAEQVGAAFAVVHCGSHWGDRAARAAYQGEPTCAAANIAGDVMACTAGCLGLGDCERACPFDAIHVHDGLAEVDFHACTACGACVRACPRNLITIEPFAAEAIVVVACSNHDKGKTVKDACAVGCIACGLCAKACDLFEIDRNLSVLDYSRYDAAAAAEALATASEKCPTGCLPYRGPGGKTGAH